MKTIRLAAALAAGLPMAVHAQELMPEMGLEHMFGTTSVLSYYVSAPDGLHFVATMNNANGDAATVYRFTLVLVDGQQIVMSMPRNVGERSEEMIFRREGDRLTVIQPEETER